MGGFLEVEEVQGGFILQEGSINKAGHGFHRLNDLVDCAVDVGLEVFVEEVQAVLDGGIKVYGADVRDAVLLVFAPFGDEAVGRVVMVSGLEEREGGYLVVPAFVLDLGEDVGGDSAEFVDDVADKKLQFAFVALAFKNGGPDVGIECGTIQGWGQLAHVDGDEVGTFDQGVDVFTFGGRAWKSEEPPGFYEDSAGVVTCVQIQRVENFFPMIIHDWLLS